MQTRLARLEAGPRPLLFFQLRTMARAREDLWTLLHAAGIPVISSEDLAGDLAEGLRPFLPAEEASSGKRRSRRKGRRPMEPWAIFQACAVTNVFVHGDNDNWDFPVECVSERNAGFWFAGSLVVVPWECAARLAYLKPTRLPRKDVVCVGYGGRRMAIYDLGRDLDYFQNVVSSAERQGIDFDQIAFYFYDVLRGNMGCLLN